VFTKENSELASIFLEARPLSGDKYIYKKNAKNIGTKEIFAIKKIIFFLLIPESQ
jgi:hypothetical protein